MTAWALAPLIICGSLTFSFVPLGPLPAQPLPDQLLNTHWNLTEIELLQSAVWSLKLAAKDTYHLKFCLLYTSDAADE